VGSAVRAGNVACIRPKCESGGGVTGRLAGVVKRVELKQRGEMSPAAVPRVQASGVLNRDK